MPELAITADPLSSTINQGNLTTIQARTRFGGQAKTQTSNQPASFVTQSGISQLDASSQASREARQIANQASQSQNNLIIQSPSLTGNQAEGLIQNLQLINLTSSSSPGFSLRSVANEYQLNQDFERRETITQLVGIDLFA